MVRVWAPAGMAAAAMVIDSSARVVALNRQAEDLLSTPAGAMIGIPVGGVFSGASGIKTAQEAVMWGGTAGVAFDPCYHQACDTFANVNLVALDVNTDAVALATLTFAMNTSTVNGISGKGNFKAKP